MRIPRIPLIVHHMEAMFDYTSLDLLADVYPAVQELKPINPTLSALKCWSKDMSTKPAFVANRLTASVGGSLRDIKHINEPFKK